MAFKLDTWCSSCIVGNTKTWDGRYACMQIIIFLCAIYHGAMIVVCACFVWSEMMMMMMSAYMCSCTILLLLPKTPTEEAISMNGEKKEQKIDKQQQNRFLYCLCVLKPINFPQYFICIQSSKIHLYFFACFVGLYRVVSLVPIISLRWSRSLPSGYLAEFWIIFFFFWSFVDSLLSPFCTLLWPLVSPSWHITKQGQVKVRPEIGMSEFPNGNTRAINNQTYLDFFLIAKTPKEQKCSSMCKKGFWLTLWSSNEKQLSIHFVMNFLYEGMNINIFCAGLVSNHYYYCYHRKYYLF